MTARTPVSVLMPVFNGEQHIREAVRSILSQSFTDFELLIVNDHSTDSTESIVREYCEQDARVTALRNEEAKGIVGALNTGLARARGDYIARMDADDVSLPTRLEQQHAFLDAQRDVSVCGTNIEVFGFRHSVWHLPQDHEAIRCALLFTVFIAHPTIMMRRSAVDHERYDPDYNYAEDYELWSRLAEHHRFANLSDVLLRYRTHDPIGNPDRETVRAHNAQRIRLRLLNRLGISPANDESRLHQQISDYRYAPSQAFARAANQWFDKILEANERHRVYDQRALKSHVEERRAEIEGAVPRARSGIRDFTHSLADLPRRMFQRS
jgi:glycosyltransferase involved in cell wall biosynthesis